MTDASDLQETDAPLNPTPWREIYGVHPAAELFPLLTRTELEELAADIKERGVLLPVLARRPDDPPTAHSGGPELEIVDGRSRLDAMTLAGLPLFESKEGEVVPTCPITVLADDVDPYAVAISANINRRHLTAEQRREAIAKVLAARPEQSNRQVARMFKVDHVTVGTVRRKAEATGEVSPVERTSAPTATRIPVKRTPRKAAALSTGGRGGRSGRQRRGWDGRVARPRRHRLGYEPEVIGETLAAIVPPTPQAVAGLADAARRVRERQGIDPADTVRGSIAAAHASADAPAADPNTVPIDLSHSARAGWQIARKLIELYGIEKATTEAGYFLAEIKNPSRISRRPFRNVR